MPENDEIEWGKKMIKISVKFWTDNLPRGVDKKTAWAKGTVHMIANPHRGLKHDTLFFNTKEQLLSKIQELLKKNGVKLIETSGYVEVDLSRLRAT
mgnify:CR=1 FL=1